MWALVLNSASLLGTLLSLILKPVAFLEPVFRIALGWLTFRNLDARMRWNVQVVALVVMVLGSAGFGALMAMRVNAAYRFAMKEAELEHAHHCQYARDCPYQPASHAKDPRNIANCDKDKVRCALLPYDIAVNEKMPSFSQVFAFFSFTEYFTGICLVLFVLSSIWRVASPWFVAPQQSRVARGLVHSSRRKLEDATVKRLVQRGLTHAEALSVLDNDPVVQDF